MAPLVRTGGLRHTGLAAPPHHNNQSVLTKYLKVIFSFFFLIIRLNGMDGELHIRKIMALADGVTEKLKSQNPMEWVRQCNNIRNRVQEIVLSELVYV